MDLDDLLTRAAPPTTPRTDGLDRELRALVRAAESRGRRRRRPAVVAGAAVAVLLGTGVAAATGAVPLPGGFLDMADGSRCHVEFFIEPTVSTGGKHYTDAETGPVVAAAEAWLEDLDLGSVDRDEAVREWRAAEAAAIASQPDLEERQPVLRGVDMETTAVYYWMTQRLAAYLTAQGLDPNAVMPGMGSRCD